MEIRVECVNLNEANFTAVIEKNSIEEITYEVVSRLKSEYKERILSIDKIFIFSRYDDILINLLYTEDIIKYIPLEILNIVIDRDKNTKYHVLFQGKQIIYSLDKKGYFCDCRVIEEPEIRNASVVEIADLIQYIKDKKIDEDEAAASLDK